LPKIGRIASRCLMTMCINSGHRSIGKLRGANDSLLEQTRRLRVPLGMTRGGARSRLSSAVHPVAIEMEDVVVVWSSVEVLAKLFEGRRPQHIHAHGKRFALDEINQRAGDRAITDIAFKRPGHDEQDVDAIAGKLWIAPCVMPTVQVALKCVPAREVPSLRTAEGFPRPGKNTWCVTWNPHGFGSEQRVPLRAGQKRGEGLDAPSLERGEYTLGMRSFRGKRVIEEVLQVPP